MDHVRILERAIDVVRRHRALWILGMLWAFVGGGAGGVGNFGGNFGNSGQYRLDEGDLGRLREGPLGRLADVDVGTWLAIGAAACLFVLVLAIVFTVARYVIQAGVFRALERLERDGIEPTVRGAWREGWHRRTWRPFIQNLAVGIPVAVLALLSLVAALSPLLLLAADNEGAKALGVVTTGGLCIGWLLVVIAVSIVVGVLQQLWWRAAVLDDEGTIAAIGTAWQIGRRSVGDLAIMWLLMVGAYILWAIVGIVLLVVFAAVTALLAGLPAWLLWRGTHQLLVPLLYGIPVGILTFVAPMLLVGGLYLVFDAAVWNQVYRQLRDRWAALLGPPAPDAGVFEAPSGELDARASSTTGDDRRGEGDTGSRPADASVTGTPWDAPKWDAPPTAELPPDNPAGDRPTSSTEVPPQAGPTV